MKTPLALTASQVISGERLPKRAIATNRFSDLPLPSGWFRIACSKELRPGKVRAIRYFNKDFVLFRTQDGVPYLLDAYCPHLGAHLGYGGKVNGETLQCPFHGWTFSGEGRCVDVPYSEGSSRTRVKEWPLTERHGFILMYYHPRATPPTWEIPALPECKDTKWIPFQRRTWSIRTHPQEIVENGIDTAHFPHLHTHSFHDLKSDAMEIAGPVMIHKLVPEYNISIPGFPDLSKKIESSMEVTHYGLGCQVGRSAIKIQNLQLKFLVLAWVTPVDTDSIEIELAISMESILSKRLTALLARKVVLDDLAKALAQDIPILENKIYRQSPVLCDGDGPIHKYRKWAQQFYVDRAD